MPAAMVPLQGNDSKIDDLTREPVDAEQDPNLSLRDDESKGDETSDGAEPAGDETE